MKLALEIAAGYFMGSLANAVFSVILNKIERWRVERQFRLLGNARREMQQAANTAQAADSGIQRNQPN